MAQFSIPVIDGAQGINGNVIVTVTDNLDGTVSFTFEQQNFVADWRGIFFDFTGTPPANIQVSNFLGDNLVNEPVDIKDTSNFATLQGVNTVTTFAPSQGDVNMNGNGNPTFDFAIATGSQGMSTDDIQKVTFTLSADTPLTGSQFLGNIIYGFRFTSSGADQNNREGSLKIVGTPGGEEENQNPTDSDECFYYTEDQVINDESKEDAGAKLYGATDPDGDPLFISDITNVVISTQPGDTTLTVQITADDFVYNILNNGNLVAVLTIGANGSEEFKSMDDVFWNSLSKDEKVELTVNYVVSDGNGGTDISKQCIEISGQNDNPVDPDECFSYTEDEVIKDESSEVAGAKLYGATDPEGDTLTISDIINVSIASQPATTNLTVQTTANDFIYNILNNGNLVAILTIGSNGSEQFASQDDAFWNSLVDGDKVELTIDYKVSDGNGGTDTSQQCIKIYGQDDGPQDPDECFSYSEDEVIKCQAKEGPGAKLEGATDPQGYSLFISDILNVQVSEQPADTSLSIQTTPNDFIYNILNNGQLVAVLSIGQDGSESFESTNNQFWNSLGEGDLVKFTVNYEVSNGHGGTDTSEQCIEIKGKNDRPCDPDECFKFTEDQVVRHESHVPTGAKLCGAYDPDGDTLFISKIFNVVVLSQPATLKLTIQTTADNYSYNILNKGIKVAELHIGADGSENFLSTNDTFWNNLLPNQIVKFGVNYEVSDGNGGTDCSSQCIEIKGQAETAFSCKTNLVLYLDNLKDQTNEICKVKIEGKELAKLKCVDDIFMWINNSKYAGCELEAFTFKSGNNFETDKALKAYLGPNEGQLVTVCDGYINPSLVNDVKTLADCKNVSFDLGVLGQGFESNFSFFG